MAQTAASETKTGSKAQRTMDHDKVRRWAEARHGRPTVVEGTQILRIDFDDPDGRQDQKLKQVSWDEFFRIFDDRGLAFLYQDRTHDGKISRFFKFVSAGSEDE